jgi:hypothetical protein
MADRGGANRLAPVITRPTADRRPLWGVKLQRPYGLYGLLSSSFRLWLAIRVGRCDRHPR